MSIGLDGSVVVLASVRGANSLAVGSDGRLYVGGDDGVSRISRAGSVELFASGFRGASGVAFDVAGNLFIADDSGNNIVRISGFPQSALRGITTNAMTGVPMEGIRVRVVQAHAPFAGRMVLTRADGTFSLPVAPGTYIVTAWADRYHTAVETNVTVSHDPQEISLSLTPVSE